MSFDEIHIKPGLQYQGKYVLGNAQNTTEATPANTMLAAKINPSFGAPAFIARLIPVINLKADFLFEIVKLVINIVHNAGGCVFSIMRENLCQSENLQNVPSIEHPFPNSKKNWKLCSHCMIQLI